jgi:uncharacterized protein (AIM24 family)
MLVGNQYGIEYIGNISAMYLLSGSGPGIVIYAGSTANGISVFAGQSSGHAIQLITVSGDGINVNSHTAIATDGTVSLPEPTPPGYGGSSYFAG